MLVDRAALPETIELFGSDPEPGVGHPARLEDVSRQGRAWVQPILIDEALTPDSSRFWPADTYKPGAPQKSFDKQFLRDWLDASGWDHSPPPPRLPEAIVRRTQERYVQALRRLFPHAMAELPAGMV